MARLSFSSSTTFDLARWRRRRRQRGAAIFVVVLVVTLLSALGIWASRSAMMVDVAAGHSRQALQIQYLADMGLQSTTAFLANGLAAEFVRQGQFGTETCTQVPAILNSPIKPFCYPFFSRHLNGTLRAPLLVLDDAEDGENSLGPHGVREGDDAFTPKLMGEFVVEMTDLGPAPPCKGCELDDVNTTVKHASVALTAIATIHHDGAGEGNACTLAGAATSGRQMMRAQAIIGPLFQ